MPIRVLVVDDSVFVRTVLQQIIQSDPELTVCDTAHNGAVALEKIQANPPDIITLDVSMPVMNGIDALKEIVDRWNIPVIMLSSLTAKGADVTVKALQMGAADFIQKPDGAIGLGIEKVSEELISKIKALGRKRMPAFKDIKFESRLKEAVGIEKKEIFHLTPDGKLGKIVAIGISTGGPKSLGVFLPKIAADVNAAFVIVQHMPPTFTEALAIRLNELCHIHVQEAKDQTSIQPGNAYIIPGDFHACVKNTGNEIKICLNQNEKVSGHRPSVDVLFESIARECKNKAVGVIMTGMGADGAKNIGLIKKAGGKTIAQDEASCVVFGMPKVAIELGNVDIISSLDMMHSVIMHALE